MANVSHATLTGSELHEPKGVATASASTVYVADGLGSGSWVDINTLLTSTNFTTGDGKLTLKTTADSTWVMANDGTIGDALSGATTRANADCEDLFTLLWNNISNTYAAVSGGRGANAAADWAAHKTIALTKQLGRAIVISGTGSGLTARTLGATFGEESHALTSAENGAHTHTGTTGTESATHTHSGTTSTESADHTHQETTPTLGNQGTIGSSGSYLVASVAAATTSGISALHTHTITTGGQSVNHTHTITTDSSGSGTAHNNMQPSAFWNIMIKL